ncbi:hypothetical protein LTR85_003694 [Meristemomyces frigidus]|nr:hypothetical protein LTR85_003694 [Meristemomyces frigidus]
MKVAGPAWRAAGSISARVNRQSLSHSVVKSSFCRSRRGCSRGLARKTTPSRYDYQWEHLQRRQASNLSAAEPTIYALSTAPGRAAIAVVRISGSACLDIYRALCPSKKAPKPRYAAVRSLYEPNLDPSSETTLDSSALVLYFPAPRTVTGEDVLELHVHGGPAVVKAVLAAIPSAIGVSTPPCIRYAEPGEFTRRAFMNNRLDLTQVEALGDTLAATTEQQRKLSVRGTTSSLATRYETWRQQLLYARGELEALIDFSEDQHFDESPAELCTSVALQVQSLIRHLQIHSHNAVRGELLRNGISISLLGAPNAGKSSLLNFIVGREAAIVSQEAGTTRDVVEVGLDIGGYFCRLSDTAGLRKAKEAALQGARPQAVIGQIEKEGMRRAKERAEESDVVVVMLSFESNGVKTDLYLDEEVIDTAAKLARTKDNIIVAVNKADVAHEEGVRLAVREIQAALPGIGTHRIHMISCKDAGAAPLGRMKSKADPGNIQAFLRGLIRQFGELTAALTPHKPDADADLSVWQESLGATERHRVLLEACINHLDSFLAEVKPSEHDSDGDVLGGVEVEADIVVAAEHLRSAADCLSKITGRGDAGDVEEVLGVVFEKFCVGK